VRRFCPDSLSRHLFILVSAFPSLPFVHRSVNRFVFTRLRLTLCSSRTSPWIAVETRKARRLREYMRDRWIGFREIATAQKFERSTSISPEPILARKDFSLGLAMGLFSAGFPTAGRGATCLASPNEPAFQFPLGRAFKPLEKLHCS
jgi:hypothetical protein